MLSISIWPCFDRAKVFIHTILFVAFDDNSCIVFSYFPLAYPVSTPGMMSDTNNIRPILPVARWWNKKKAKIVNFDRL